MKSGDDRGVSRDSGDTSICIWRCPKSCYLWESMGFDTEFGWNLATIVLTIELLIISITINYIVYSTNIYISRI